MCCLLKQANKFKCDRSRDATVLLTDEQPDIKASLKITLLTGQTTATGLYFPQLLNSHFIVQKLLHPLCQSGKILYPANFFEKQLLMFITHFEQSCLPSLCLLPTKGYPHSRPGSVLQSYLPDLSNSHLHHLQMLCSHFR